MCFLCFLEYDENVKHRDLKKLVLRFKENIARNASYWITLTHINILFAFLAIFSHFGFFKANVCRKFKITQYFCQKFKSTHSEAHLSKICGLGHYQPTYLPT